MTNKTRRFHASLTLCLSVCLFVAAMLEGWSEDPQFGGLLSPEFKITHQTKSGLGIEWKLSEGSTDTVLYAILALPGPIQQATQSVASFRWTVRGATPHSGDQSDFDEKNPKRTAPRIQIRELGYLAGVRIASLQLRFYYSSVAADPVMFPQGLIQLQFNQIDPLRFDSFPKDIAPIAKALLLNEPSRKIAAPPEFLDAPYLDKRALKLYSAAEEVAQIPADEILEAYKQDIEISRLALFQRRLPVERAVVDETGKLKSRGLLNPDDTVLFYAPASESAFATETVTWFTLDKESVRTFQPFAQQKSTPSVNWLWQTTRYEQDYIFIDGKPTNEEQNSNWMWADLTEQATPEFLFSINEPPRSATAALDMRLYIDNARSDALVENVTPSIDGVRIDWSVSAGTGFIEAAAALSPDLLQPGTHRLTFEGVDTATTARLFESIDLDWFDIGFGSVVTPATTPYQTPNHETSIALSGAACVLWLAEDKEQAPSLAYSAAEVTTAAAGRLLIANKNRASHNFRVGVYDPSDSKIKDLLNLSQSDVILIAPSAWHSTLTPFRDSLLRQGLTVRIASVEAMYDCFGDGRLSPFAVREFLRYAYRAWKRPTPSYVLMIGDATWDYYNRYGVGVKNYVPGYRAKPEYAVENWFVRLDDDSDAVPDMMIGRWPLRSAGELKALIEKTVRYKEELKPQPWLNRMFLLTDHGFDRFSEELEQEWIPKGFRLTQRHVKDYPLIDNIYLPEKLRADKRAKTSLAATQDVIRILNEGVWLMEFFGHGAPNVVGNERLFFGGGSKFTDVKKLKNAGRPFLFWSFSCETSTFDYPRQKWNISIGEDMLTHADGGAVGLLGAAGRGYPHDHIVLARGMHEALFHHGLQSMGQVLLSGNLLGLTFQSAFEPIDQFCFLGDPTIVLPRFLSLAVDAEKEQGNLSVFLANPQAANHATHGAAWVQSGSDVIRYATMSSPVERVFASFDVSGVKALYAGAEAVSKRDGRIIVAHGAQPVARAAAAVIEATTGRLPDLVIEPGSLCAAPVSPRSGETVFLDGVIKNQGQATAQDIFIQGRQAPQGKKKAPFHVVVGGRGERVERLDPGESAAVRLRWDPTANKGPYDLEMTVDPFNQIQEENEDNNSLEQVVAVRRKADLLVEEDRFKLTPIEDGKRYRVDFSIINKGESGVDKILIEMAFAYRGSGKRLSHYVPEIINLDPGQRYNAGQVRIPSNIDYFELIIDPDELVDEETHANNTFRYTVD